MKFAQFLQSDFAQNPHYLLIGNPVSQSVSPLMHNTALGHHQINAQYVAVQVELDDFSTLIAHFNSPKFLGANITIPFKHELLHVVDRLSTEAITIGAINTLIKKRDELIGHNTDAFGFIQPLKDLEEDVLETDRAIIFGSGGATKAIIYALNDYGFEEVYLVSRKPNNCTNHNGAVICSYDDWIDYSEEASLIVNATPVGMYPNVENSPVKDVEVEHLAGKVCYDIVYNPLETLFLRQAKTVGGLPIGGLDMLIYQGAESFNKWTDKHFPVGLIKMKLDEYFSV